MITRKNRLNFFILIFSLVAIVFCYVFVFFRNIKFNMTEHFVNLDELNEESEIQFSIYERGGESDYWISGLSEEARYETGLDSLKGITFDAVIENNTSYVITDWSLRLVANTRVYIERAWCGKVEIFQSFKNSYLSQNLDLRNFDDSDIRVKAIRSGNSVFFPLNKDDFIVYHPNLSEKEYPLIEMLPGRRKSFAKVGFIFYCDPAQETVELSNGTIFYRLNREVSKDPAFGILLLVSAIWIFSLIFFCIIEDRLREMEKTESRDKKIIQDVMEIFSGFVDAKDPYTGGHSNRVARYSKLIAKEMGMDSKTCQQIFYCGLLHDCGKIGIHDDILSKPERLSDDEFEEIRKHTRQGFEILSGLTAIPEACMVARYHHERYDGSGYPDGLKGEAIPLYARIICVADAFDAMNSNRCYRRHMSQNEILAQFKASSGKQFDKAVADALIRLLKRGEIEYLE